MSGLLYRIRCALCVLVVLLPIVALAFDDVTQANQHHKKTSGIQKHMLDYTQSFSEPEALIPAMMALLDYPVMTQDKKIKSYLMNAYRQINPFWIDQHDQTSALILRQYGYLDAIAQNEGYGIETGYYRYFGTHPHQCPAATGQEDIMLVKNFFVYPLVAWHPASRLDRCAEHVRPYLNSLLNNLAYMRLSGVVRQLHRFNMVFKSANFDPKVIMDHQVCQCTIDQAKKLMQDMSTYRQSATFNAVMQSAFSDRPQVLNYLTTRLSGIKEIPPGTSREFLLKMIQRARAIIPDIISYVDQVHTQHTISMILQTQLKSKRPVVTSDASLLFQDYIESTPIASKIESYKSLLYGAIRPVSSIGSLLKDARMPLFLGKMLFLKKLKVDNENYTSKLINDSFDLVHLRMINDGRYASYAQHGYQRGSAFDAARKKKQSQFKLLNTERERLALMLNDARIFRSIYMRSLFAASSSHRIPKSRVALPNREQIARAALDHDDLIKLRLQYYLSIQSQLLKRHQLLNQLVFLNAAHAVFVGLDASSKTSIQDKFIKIKDLISVSSVFKSPLASPKGREDKAIDQAKKSSKEDPTHASFGVRDEAGGPYAKDDKNDKATQNQNLDDIDVSSLS